MKMGGRTLGREGELAVLHDGRHLEDLEPRRARSRLRRVGVGLSAGHVDIEVLQVRQQGLL